MKNIYILLIVVFAISFTSCEDLDINENPNKVEKTHPELLLRNIAVDAFEVDGKSAMYASRMIVATDGESSSQYYKWGRSGFGDYNQLRQVTKMMEEAKRIDNDSYIAIAHFFRAHYFYNLTLTFGDIPYEEALKGETGAIYNPKYTSQEDVFKGILAELKEANELMKKGVDIGTDPIYNGIVLNWRKLINSFRLKVLMTLSKKVDNSGLDIKSTFNSIYNEGVIINSPSESARLNFFDVVNSRYSEFNSSSYGSGLYMASTFIDLLKDREDPRLFVIASRTKEAKEAGLAISDFNAYNGGDPIKPYNDVNLLASKGKVSKVNDRYSKDATAESHNVLSYSELQFILAEASLRGWISGDTKQFYTNAVSANFGFYKTFAKGYSNHFTEENITKYFQNEKVNFDNATDYESKLELIMTQKYFTTFLQGGWRMYFDHLRTGYPKFPYIGSNTPPTRWIYPMSEYNNNSENVKQAISGQFGGSDEIRKLTWWLK